MLALFMLRRDQRSSNFQRFTFNFPSRPTTSLVAYCNKIPKQARLLLWRKQLSLNGMFLLDYDLKNKNRFWEDMEKMHENCVVYPVYRLFRPRVPTKDGLCAEWRTFKNVTLFHRFYRPHLIPRAKLFIQIFERKDVYMFLHWAVWLICSVRMLNKLYMESEEKNIWSKGERGITQLYRLMYIDRKKSKLF